MAVYCSLVLLLSVHFIYSNAQLTSSSGIFTFCPQESVTLTCSLSSGLHIWRLSNSSTAPAIVLLEGLHEQKDSSKKIVFNVTAHTGGTLTMSTMSFTASEDVISKLNGTSVFCGGANNDNPRDTFTETVNILGRVSPPHLPTLNRTSIDYTSLTLTYQPPLYGHECVIGYTVTGPNLERNMNTTMLVITGLNLCRNVYNISMFAHTMTGNGSEVTVQSSIPDFTDLGRVSNVSVSSEDYLHWSSPTNAPVDCISGYTIQWSGSSIFIPNNATNVSVATLISGSNNHLPFCVEVPTLVIPSVPIVPESPLNVTQNDPPVSLVYKDPEFPSPSITLRGNGNEGTGFDTVVSWQDIPSSFAANTTVTAGVYDGECQANLTTGVFKVIPHVCSDAGKSLSFCVVFDYMLCTTSSVSTRQLPSPESTATATIANAITLSTDLQYISGERCDVERLDVDYALFFTEFLKLSSSKTYRKNEITFTGLASGTTYGYQINITEESVVIATSYGTATTRKTVTINEAIGITFSLTFIISLTIGFGLGILATLCYKSKRFSMKSNNEESPVELEGEFYEQVCHPKTSNVEVSVDTNIAYAVPVDTNIAYAVPVDTNIAYAVPVDTNIAYAIPVDANIAYSSVSC